MFKETVDACDVNRTYHCLCEPDYEFDVYCEDLDGRPYRYIWFIKFLRKKGVGRLLDRYTWWCYHCEAGVGLYVFVRFKTLREIKTGRKTNKDDYPTCQNCMDTVEYGEENNE